MRHRPGVEAEEIRPRSDMVDFADETRRPKEAGSVGSVGRSFRQKGVKPYRGVGGDFWSVRVELCISRRLKSNQGMKTLSVGKTINSPLLTHKIAISLSLMRIYVLYFSDVYHCPNLKLTHKSALKSRLQKFINFSLKRFVICLFRRRYGSKWRA